MNLEHNLRELEVFQRLSSANPPDSRCPRLLAHFLHPGIDEDGEHLCLVTELFWSSFEDSQALLRNSRTPAPIAKRILTHVLRGLARLHALGIVHTGLLLYDGARTIFDAQKFPLRYQT